jgi:hypothetical protein
LGGKLKHKLTEVEGFPGTTSANDKAIPVRKFRSKGIHGKRNEVAVREKADLTTYAYPIKLRNT